MTLPMQPVASKDAVRVIDEGGVVRHAEVVLRAVVQAHVVHEEETIIFSTRTTCLTVVREAYAVVVVGLGVAAGVAGDGPAREVERRGLVHLWKGRIGGRADPTGVSFAHSEQDAGKRRRSS
eukprot:2451182-Pyramimonas_sp.AAC.1